MASIETHRLPNGLTLLTETMPAAQSAAMTLLVPAGVATQPAEHEGVAPLLADHVGRGAGGLSAREHSDALDTLGVQRDTDAQTRWFSISAVMLGQHLPAALPLLLDMALRPNLEGETFAPCLDLALQALDALEDEPQQRALLELRERHLPEPLGRNPYGRRETLESLTAGDVRAFWEKRFCPGGAGGGGAVLTVAGAVEVEALREQVGALTASWSGDAPPAVVGEAGPRVYTHRHDDSTQLHIGVGYDAVPETHADAVLQRVAVAALSGGMSGRLFTEVREKRGLCYSVYASYAGQADRGDVYAYAGTTTPRAQETLDVLVGELQRIGEGVDQSEFDRAVVGMKSGLVMQGESTQARASALANDFVILGQPRSLAERAAEVDAVTLGALNDFLGRRGPGVMSIVTLGAEPLVPPTGTALASTAEA